MGDIGRAGIIDNLVLHVAYSAGKTRTCRVSSSQQKTKTTASSSGGGGGGGNDCSVPLVVVPWLQFLFILIALHSLSPQYPIISYLSSNNFPLKGVAFIAKGMMKLSVYTLAVIALSGATTTSNAFVVQTPRAIVVTTSSSRTPQQQEQQSPCTARFMSERDTTESAFVADVVVGEEDGEVEDDEDKTFEAVEMMGKGAAKVRTYNSHWCE